MENAERKIRELENKLMNKEIEETSKKLKIGDEKKHDPIRDKILEERKRLEDELKKLKSNENFRNLELFDTIEGSENICDNLSYNFSDNSDRASEIIEQCRIIREKSAATELIKDRLYDYKKPFFDKQEENAKNPIHGFYQGKQNVTLGGKTCQYWDKDDPHVPNGTVKSKRLDTNDPAKLRDENGNFHNYCRNPDNDAGGIWCYTTDSAKRWEYCSPLTLSTIKKDVKFNAEIENMLDKNTTCQSILDKYKNKDGTSFFDVDELKKIKDDCPESNE